MEFSEDAQSFGIGTTKELSWKHVLDGAACVECGRCSEVCPATNTQKSLDPRKIMGHLKTALSHLKNPKKQPVELLDNIVSSDEIWDCTTCGACMEACPIHLEHIPPIIGMRRYLTMTKGEVSEQLQTTLENLENQGNPWGFNNNDRANWSKGLQVPTIEENPNADYLFWVGCAGSFDNRYKKVSQSIAKILNKANINFAILGKHEKCNGDSARRAGQEYLADMQIKENIETLKSFKVKKIITGCPHCFHTIKNEYPDFDYKVDVIHHSQLIDKLIDENKITPPSSKQLTTYHDSCYLGRHNNIYTQPRKSLKNISTVEMPRNKNKGFCCGAGGARMWMEETQGTRINVERAKEAVTTKAQTVATACPFCMTMMTDGIKTLSKDVQVKDVAEIIAQDI